LGQKPTSSAIKATVAASIGIKHAAAVTASIDSRIRFAAVRANAGDLDHRRLRREARCACGGAQLLGHRGGRRLADHAAALADQEHHEVAAGVIVDAGDEGVAALDAVHEAVVAQEVERAVDGDRRRARAGRGGAVHDLVGAERLVALEQDLQHLAAQRRQPLRAPGAQRLGVGQRVGGAAAMVVARRVKDGLRHRRNPPGGTTPEQGRGNMEDRPKCAQFHLVRPVPDRAGNYRTARASIAMQQKKRQLNLGRPVRGDGVRPEPQGFSDA
jgi:hypothetical protein